MILLEEQLNEAAKVVKATPANLIERLEHLMADMKALQSENESLKSKAAKDALGDVMDQVADVKGVKLLATSVDGVDMNGLRDLGDSLKEKLGDGVVVLASANDGKVNLIAMATLMRRPTKSAWSACLSIASIITLPASSCQPHANPRHIRFRHAS